MSGEVEGTLSTATEREFELAGGPYAATAARLALDNLDAELDPVLAQDLRLLVTEAVKNSVQHAGVGPEESIGLKIVVQAELIRIEVSDDGPGFEPDASRPDRGRGHRLGPVPDRSARGALGRGARQELHGLVRGRPGRELGAGPSRG